MRRWLVLVGAVVCLLELRTSWIQAQLLSLIAAQLDSQLAPGAGERTPLPSSGPRDERLGYAQLPAFLSRLEADGFQIRSQARGSSSLHRMTRWGVTTAYRERAQTGLGILDTRNRLLFQRSFPQEAYRSYADLPPLMVQTLLFIENRELLEPASIYRNPAVEWDRLLYSAALWSRPRRDGSLPGASTLATQLEKYRHSPGGQTASVGEKLRQMASASLRAYRAGPDTRAARERVVLDYVNTVPLAAHPLHGEVAGIPDGLRVWRKRDPADVTDLLWNADGERSTEAGRAYADVLMLFLSQRRPTHYLRRDPQGLERLAHRYLGLLQSAGIISEPLRLAAQAALSETDPGEADSPADPAGDKATLAIRHGLLRQLGVPSLHSLDRLDLTVHSTLDGRAQRQVRERLHAMRDPANRAALGLTGRHLLDRGDPSQVVYSLLLYESTPQGNLLRVQADTLAGPFDINEGTKLDLGSTAKLRTLIDYLSIVEQLRTRLAGRTREELAELELHPKDRIGQWVVARLRRQSGIAAEELLEAAMERRYSAAPGRAFHTGGASHRFENFDADDNTRVLSVRSAFRRSVNLPFIRLMRDVVHHTLYGPEGLARALEDDPDGALRRTYLLRFSRDETRELIARHHHRLHGLDPEARWRALVERTRRTPSGLAALLRSVRPAAGVAELDQLLRDELGAPLPEHQLARLLERFDPERAPRSTRARSARLHPIELWVAERLEAEPGLSRADLEQASEPPREEAYRWLLHTRHRRAQDLRIQAVLERDAFAQLHLRWKRLGYPFDGLVPSLATAIGTSADRPSALAELMGIVLRDCVRHPRRRIRQLHFAAGTPYETTLTARTSDGERVLPVAVAQVVRGALLEVVAQGTALRARGGFRGADGSPVAVGGKTGTADPGLDDATRAHARPGAQRTATFAFLLGDRHFGVITAFVEGSDVGGYQFTSSLPVQVLRNLAPALEPML